MEILSLVANKNNLFQVITLINFLFQAKKYKNHLKLYQKLFLQAIIYSIALNLDKQCFFNANNAGLLKFSSKFPFYFSKLSDELIKTMHDLNQYNKLVK